MLDLEQDSEALKEENKIQKEIQNKERILNNIKYTKLKSAKLKLANKEPQNRTENENAHSRNAPRYQTNTASDPRT